VIIGDVEMVPSKFCDINVMLPSSSLEILLSNNCGNVEDDSKESDGDEICKKAHSMRCLVIENLVIVERVKNCNVAFRGKSNCHKDRSGHGDGVKRVEDVRE
jgi:hypothetical protein